MSGLSLRSTGFLGSISSYKSGWSENLISATGINGNTSPNLCNNYFRRSILIWKYSANEIMDVSKRKRGWIVGLRFFVNNQPNNQPYPNYSIGLKQGSFSNNPGNTSYTIVKNPEDTSFVSNTFSEFIPLDTPYYWSENDLAFCVAWGAAVNWSSTGQSPIGSGELYYSWTDTSGTYVINESTTSSVVSYRPVVQLFFSNFSNPNL